MFMEQNINYTPQYPICVPYLTIVLPQERQPSTAKACSNFLHFLLRPVHKYSFLDPFDFIINTSSIKGASLESFIYATSNRTTGFNSRKHFLLHLRADHWTKHYPHHCPKSLCPN
ncbi:unnamed protein product [Prunus brigantina]